MDSLQMYESLMAIITEASSDGDGEGGGGWGAALEKVSELMFWDDMPENKELFFIKDTGRKHQTFYKPSSQIGPQSSSQKSGDVGERSGGDRSSGDRYSSEKVTGGRGRSSGDRGNGE